MLPTHLVSLPNWLQVGKKEIYLFENLESQMGDAELKSQTFGTITNIQRNVKRLADFSVLKDKDAKNCGFCFGALPHNYDRSKYLPINDYKVFDAIFAHYFVRAINEYTDRLQKVVFWYAVEFFIINGTQGTPYSPDQIAGFLKDMPIWFWEVS